MKKSELKVLIREVIEEMGADKLHDIDIIAGEIIVAIEGQVNEDSLRLRCKSGNHYDISLDPDEYAKAYFNEINMAQVINKEIVRAYHTDKNVYGATLVFVGKDNSKGTIHIENENNGYYGFSYHVTKGRN